jgi:hypothetical protein
VRIEDGLPFGQHAQDFGDVGLPFVDVATLEFWGVEKLVKNLRGAPQRSLERPWPTCDHVSLGPLNVHPDQVDLAQFAMVFQPVVQSRDRHFKMLLELDPRMDVPVGFWALDRPGERPVVPDFSRVLGGGPLGIRQVPVTREPRDRADVIADCGTEHSGPWVLDVGSPHAQAARLGLETIDVCLREPLQ